MGNGRSKLSQPPDQNRLGLFNRAKGLFFGNQTQQFQPQSLNFKYLDFILRNPPVKVNLPQQTTPTNQSKNNEILGKLKDAIIEYNKTWNFGNNQLNGTPQSLLKDNTYEQFKIFVKNLLTNQQAQNTLPQGMRNLNKQSFQEKKEIVKKIHEILQANYSLVNKFFDVRISVIFPGIPNNKYISVTLLGLASIIGAEHIVIYLLMCGADSVLSLKNIIKIQQL